MSRIGRWWVQAKLIALGEKELRLCKGITKLPGKQGIVGRGQESCAWLKGDVQL